MAGMVGNGWFIFNAPTYFANAIIWPGTLNFTIHFLGYPFIKLQSVSVYSKTVLQTYLFSDSVKTNS